MPQRSTRRHLFTRATQLAAATSLAPSLAAATSDESYWQLVRQQFAFPESRVPMNAANLCPTPASVAAAVADLTRDIDQDCSFQNRAKFAANLESARAVIANQLNVSPNEIALVRNTSEANNTVNNGIDLQSGDEIVLWDQNHPTNNVAWDVRAKRFGLRVKRVAVPANPDGAADLVAPFEKAITPRTRVLAVTQVSNVSGIRLPCPQLAEIAHRRNIHFHVDGAQTWGALAVDLREIGADSYAASAHKWFCGPKEVGLLYVKASRIPHIWPNVVAPGWGDGPETALIGARKFESLGQRDDAALTGLGLTANLHKTLGPRNVEAHMMALAQRLKEGLAEAGASLVTPMDPSLSAGVVILQVPSANRRKLLDAMYKEHGIAGSTSGGFRLCPHLYNTAGHIDRAIEGVRTLKSLWA